MIARVNCGPQFLLETRRILGFPLSGQRLKAQLGVFREEIFPKDTDRSFAVVVRTTEAAADKLSVAGIIWQEPGQFREAQIVLAEEMVPMALGLGPVLRGSAAPLILSLLHFQGHASEVVTETFYASIEAMGIPPLVAAVDHAHTYRTNLDLVSREAYKTIPTVDLDRYQIRIDFVGMVGGIDTCLKYKIVPVDFDFENRTLILAMEDPNALLVIDDIKYLIGCEVIPVLADRNALLAAIGRVQKEELERRYRGVCVRQPTSNYVGRPRLSLDNKDDLKWVQSLQERGFHYVRVEEPA